MTGKPWGHGGLFQRLRRPTSVAVQRWHGACQGSLARDFTALQPRYLNSSHRSTYPVHEGDGAMCLTVKVAGHIGDWLHTTKSPLNLPDFEDLSYLPTKVDRRRLFLPNS